MCVASASNADDRFTFEKYPASAVSNKALAKVDWSSNKALAGQWRIKESIEGTVGKKADFAGHFVVATYGCGTGCQATVFVDVNDGKLYKAPMQFPSESDALAPANGGVGPIDILAIDSDGSYVVFELKRGRVADKAIGQISRYMGWLITNSEEGTKVKGVIVAKDISQNLRHAVVAVPNVSLFEYHISFTLNEIKAANAR